ncbi:hypothetical protein TBR22_A07180 [Luteitalea sp. TBR-22]|uniref:protein O-mannosyl-transferase family n=1 Tax=Luteitalea sp. TBR-22 TaxID=2802971 RepID=UPI001AF73BC0|nr:DUF2723 domain-containing protein [Luteitalea sp. TBR-22]BCS31517.1 hypothetical protein TBR22_A07180 [Luteitalea sp. TBR-22]
MRGTAPFDRLVPAVAALFLCAHLAWLPRHLEDIDSINFALGLQHYDVAAHQPHPPGYPVFTLVARGVASVLEPLAPDPQARAAMAMALLSGLAAALALIALHRILRIVVRDASSPADSSLPGLVVLLVAAAPLFWITAARPLSDMAGLAAALGCQWLLLRARWRLEPLRTALLAGLACGLATGVRSQVAWLVVPLLAWVCVGVWRRFDLRAALGVAAASLAGVIAWAVPMVWLTGGAAAYRAALASQAGEDFDGVPMLFLQPGVRRLLVALGDTFVSPWGWWPVAAVAIALALVGLLALRARPALATWLTLGFLPYLVYHLLFQETETTRYALPLVPAVATLVVLALVRWVPRYAAPAAVVAAGVVLAVAGQAHQQYVGAGVTSGEAMTRLATDAQGAGATVLMHRRVWAETRRARATLTPTATYTLLPAPRSHEWQGATAALQRGVREIRWLVDPRRGDRGAIDPRAFRLDSAVRWPMPVAAMLGGMRPHAFDVYRVVDPQWMLGDGWGLSPELAGLSAAAGQGPSTTGSSAWVRTQPGPVTIVVGGRHLAPAGASPAVLEIRVGSRHATRVEVPPGPFAIVRTLPDVTGAERYVPLEVRALGITGDERIFLEQFDAQPVGTPVIALGTGWYEPERDVATGRQWRWVGDESHFDLAGLEGKARLVVAGTYPRHYDRQPVLEMFVDGRRVARHELPRPFRFEDVLDARPLDGRTRVTWRVSPSFVAGERTGTADARRLALEIGTIRVDAVR